MKDFDKAIELFPRRAYAYNNRGIVKRLKNDLKGAIRDFDQTIKFIPTYAHAYDNRGAAKMLSKDLAGAIKDFDEANSLYRGGYSANLYCHVARQTQQEMNEGTRKEIFQFCESVIAVLNEASFKGRAENQSAERPMHYTSFGALRSLMENGQFRLYDATGMDDASEGKFIFERMGITDSDDAIRRLIDEDEKAGGSEVFVGSFVTNSNNDVGDDLMWRTYGDQRTGCALVFEKFSHSSFEDVFGKLMQPEQVKEPIDDPAKALITEEELILCRVYYGHGQMEKELKVLGERLKELKVEELSEDSRSLVRTLLDFVRFLFKKKIYSREEEVRLVVRRPSRQEIDNSGEGVVRSEFSRTYVQCPAGFRPRRILLGPSVKRADRCRGWIESQEWSKSQEGLEAVEVRASNPHNGGN